MKILSVENIRSGDAYTIANEPISSINLMERAASKCTEWIIENYPKNKYFTIFAGIGNNGGDALAIARMLINKGLLVKVFIVNYSSKYSNDFTINLKRLKEFNTNINFISDSNPTFEIDSTTIIIEGIFGSGLSRAVTGIAAEVIDSINNTANIIISIDIASGLFADKLNDDKNAKIIIPNHTLSLAFPKLSFFLAENEAYVGQWHHIDIGIHPRFNTEVKETAYLVEKTDISPLLHKRSRFSHKGTYGHALLIAGSYGKIGASVLASKACLRTGVGLLTIHIPSTAVNILQTAVPEAMLSIDTDKYVFSKNKKLEKYNAIGIGPGLGTDKKSQLALKLLLQNTPNPLVIDADALNILSENKTWMAFLPKNSILTPHPKEFERLFGKSYNSIERIEKQKQMSIKFGIFIVLKGSYSSISTPDGRIYFNSSGNPGMATAGSGDTLTGIILSLLAQNYNPEIAALMGVYVHGIAGDIAAIKLGFEAMIASDIIDNLAQAFIELQN